MTVLDVAIEQARPISLRASLTCGRGELVALVGPSGSGKSTVLKTIAGLLTGASGHVRVGGRDWLDTARGIDLPAHRRKVGFVFQSYALFPHMTALDNVMASTAGGPEARRRRATEWLELMRMSGLEGRKPGQLSGGQQQRVALARALAREPEVLLLDEPFSAVDQMTRDRLYEELAELRKRLSIPTVFVTHSIPEAQMLADRMVVLHRGRTLQAGTPDEIYRRPVEPDVARLLGHKNLLEATVVQSDDDGILLDWKGLTLRAEGRAAPGPSTFVIPASDIRIVVRPDDPRANRFDGTITAITRLGGMASIRVALPNGSWIVLTAPTHIVEGRGLKEGGSIQVAFVVSSVHVMPAEPAQAKSAGEASP